MLNFERFDKEMMSGVVWSLEWEPDKHLRAITVPVLMNGHKLVAYKAGSRRIRYYHFTNCWHCGGGYLASRWDSMFCSSTCRKRNSRIGR